MKRSIASILMMAVTFASALTMMTASVRAETIVFTAQLLPSNEVAPVVVDASEKSGFGTAVVTLDVTRDASNNITAATTRFDVSLAGFPSTSSVILSHVHEGAAGVNGPVRIDSGISPATAIPLTGGGANYTRTGLATSTAIAAAVIANPSGFYFNVHTALSPGGVARGQLVRQQQTGIAAPTLSEWGLILMALLVIAACAFFLAGRSRAAAALATVEQPVAFSSAASIDWKLLAKTALYVEAIICLALVALSAGAIDVFGALTSGLIVAFIIHLLIGSMRRR